MIILVCLYQAHLIDFKQLNQSIFICLFDNTTKLMSLYAISFSLSLSLSLFNPIPRGGVMQICITLDIFFNTAKTQICTHSKLFNF